MGRQISELEAAPSKIRFLRFLRFLRFERERERERVEIFIKFIKLDHSIV